MVAKKSLLDLETVPPTLSTPEYLPIQTDATTVPPVSETPIPANLIPPQIVPTAINPPVIILPPAPAPSATSKGTPAPQVPSVNDPAITTQIAPQYVPPVIISQPTPSPAPQPDAVATAVNQQNTDAANAAIAAQNQAASQPTAATVATTQAAAAISSLPPPATPSVKNVSSTGIKTEPVTPVQPENSPPGVLPDAIFFDYIVNATIFVLPSNRAELFVVNLQNKPPIPKLFVSIVLANQTINLLPIPLALEDAIMTNFKRLAFSNIMNFFDNDRVLKTLLNFGTDYQALLTNWKPDDTDTTGQGIVVKLYKPLPSEVVEKTPVFISRELAYPILDKVFVIEAPAAAPNVYLRHPNKRIKVTGAYGSSVNNVTQTTLFSSGAFDIVQPQDAVLQEWFTTNLEGAELNIDYSNFRNFVFFGSAQKHIDAFTNKLKLIEDFEAAILFNSASMSITGSTVFTGSLVYNSLSAIAQQRQDIIRSFDGYERYLYYESGSAFSASFVPDIQRDTDDPIYAFPGSWPKVSGSVVAVSSSLAALWLSSSAIVAQAYDSWNVNRLVNNLPTYLQDDATSVAYIHFFDLTGHMFDVVKSYVDHMSDIYDRDSNPEVGLSQDMVWDIANAFGINLPNQYSLQTLFNYTLGQTSDKVYRQLTTETWRRFLHSQIFLMKTKGTKTALRALLNTYGVLPTTIQIRESSAPSSFFESQSFENYEEQTQALAFNSGAFLAIPWSSSAYPPITLEARFNTTLAGTSQTLLDAGGTWSVVLTPGTGSNYRVTVYAASTPVMSSSFWPIATGDYFNLMLQYTTSSVSMSLARADDDGTILFNDKASDGATLPSIWEAPLTLDIGSGSGNGVFVGNIDEFRVWGEATTEQIFEDWVQYPGLYNGNNTDSAATELWVRLSFNRPTNLGTGSKTQQNEAPLAVLNQLPAAYTAFSASGFTNVSTYPFNEVVYSRNVLRYTPVGGGTQFDSNKIIIADPPVLQYFSGSAIPVLHRDSSIVSVTDKIEKNPVANNVVGFYFSATEAINDSIIRSIGNIDINNLIGDPGYLASGSYHALDVLNEFYWKYYAYSINTNNFISFIENLMGPLFEQAENLVPARAKLMSGVVIEPHILERHKTYWKPLLKDTADLPNAPALSYQPDEVTAEITDNEAVFDMNKQIILAADNTDHETSFDLMETLNPIADMDDTDTTILLSDYQFPFADLENYDAVVDQTSDDFIAAELENFSVTIDINEVREQTTTDVATQPTLVSPYTPTYGSLNNLEGDIGATEYFSNPYGFEGQLAYGKVQLRGSTLNDKGTWVQGTMYTKNDMVLQPTTITDTRYTTGNGKLFYAIGTSFISNIPPYGDVSNWRSVAYTSITSVTTLKAVLISGSVSLVPTGSALPPVQGYLPQHFRFFRPTYTAFTRSRYTGCVQTDQTTIGGKPNVEILPSSGDRLVVASSTAPVQTPTPTGGPTILNVV